MLPALPSSASRLRRPVIFAALALLCGLIALMGQGGAIFGFIDGPAMAAVDRQLVSVLGSFAGARALNAVISVAQNSGITAGLGVEIQLALGQALDPINSLIEQLSTVLLSATVTLSFLRLLLLIGQDWALAFLITPGLIMLAMASWPGGHGAALRKPAVLLLTLGLFGRFGLPLVMIAGEALSTHLLTAQAAAAQAKMDAVNLNDLTAKLGEMITLDTDVIKARLNELAAVLGDLAGPAIDLVQIWLLKAVLLPLLLAWLLTRLIGSMIASIAGGIES